MLGTRKCFRNAIYQRLLRRYGALLNKGGKAAQEVDAALGCGFFQSNCKGNQILAPQAAATREMGVTDMRLLTIGIP